MMLRAIPIVLLVMLAGCVSPQRTDLTPAQREHLQNSISLATACDSLTTVVRALQFHKRKGKISVAQDQKIIAVLNVTDPVCLPGARPPLDLHTVLLMVRSHLADLQRLERESAK